MSSFVFFCIQICLIQYAFSQRVNGPAVGNNGLPYGSNVGLGNPLSGQASGVITGPGMGPMGPNQALGSYGMPGSTYGGAGMPNSAYGGAGMSNMAYGGAGMPNAAYGGVGMLNPTYGGAGNGDVAVIGELPVAGMTAVTGQVPLTGKVSFNGNIPCGGIVTISGGCTSCGCNAPYSQMPAYGNNPYGY